MIASLMYNRLKRKIMGYRLLKIFTRGGDKGSTGLGDGSKTSKFSDRIVALGAIDELNSMIGLMLTESLPPKIYKILTVVQHHLFNLGGEISMPGHKIILKNDVLELEEIITSYNKDLPPLKEFILPGGSRAAAFCHMARTICRRSEQAIFKLNAKDPINAYSLQFINRLSDLLFVLARVINKHKKVKDVFWKKDIS
jgi:cob(I)alamin adenosyltransferase